MQGEDKAFQSKNGERHCGRVCQDASALSLNHYNFILLFSQKLILNKFREKSFAAVKLATG